jgi:hypothetical protein
MPSPANHPTWRIHRPVAPSIRAAAMHFSAARRKIPMMFNVA